MFRLVLAGKQAGVNALEGVVTMGWFNGRNNEQSFQRGHGAGVIGFFKGCLGALLLWASLPVAAAELGLKNYEVYRGLIDGDSIEDIYVYFEPKFVLISIGNIPLFVEDDSYLLTGNADGSFDAPVIDNTVDVTALTEQTTGVTDGDLDGDTLQDMSIESTSPSHQDIWVLGHSSGTPTVIEASPILGPSSSDTGTFTLTWPSGFELRADNSSWRYADDTNTSHAFSSLPSGVYRFQLYDCTSTCSVEGNPKAVTVTRDVEPSIEYNSTEAGTTGYTASTSTTGKAQIAVPLRTIPGVNGLAPNLSLQYDNARRVDVVDIHKIEDYIGYGWRMEGLSKLHRCRSGVGGSVTILLDQSDRLCLNGQQLTVVSGLYWADNSEYRTSVQSGVKVVKKAGDYFEVSYPDGRVTTFGDTSSSKVLASGQLVAGTGYLGNSPTYIWGERQTTNGFGDTYTVDYHAIDSHGVLLPKEVSYTGAKVNFYYGPRDDIAHALLGFNFPAKVTQIAVLNKIKVSMNGTDVREYRLDSNLVSDHMRLEQIQECGYDDSGVSSTCMRPLVIGWNSISAISLFHPIAVSSFTDGLGAVTEYVYDTITSSSNPVSYTEEPFGTATVDPLDNVVTLDASVVKEMKKSDGLTPGGRLSWTYRYKSNAYRSSQYFGYFGFHETRVKDEQTGLYTYTQRRLDSDLRGSVSQVRVFDGAYPGGTEKMREERSYVVKTQTGLTRFVYADYVARWEFEGSSVVSASITENDVCFRTLSSDTCPGSGTEIEHPTQRTVTTTTGNGISNPSFTPGFWGDVPVRSITGVQQTSENKSNLQNTTTPWVIGNATKEVLTNTATGESTETATHTFDYKSGTRVVASATQFSGNSGLNLTKTRTFTGNELTSKALSGADFTSRTESFGNYLDDRYPRTLTNALSQVSTLTWDSRFGRPKTYTDPDSNIRTITYDNFGRVTNVEDIDGRDTAIAYESCAGACNAVSDAVAAMKVTTTVNNGSTQLAPTRVEYRDVHGRVVLEEEEAFASADGNRRVRRLYNNDARLEFISVPYFSTQSTPSCATAANCTKLTYDDFNRVTREDRPDGGYTVHSFSGIAGELTVTSTETVKKPVGTDETRIKKSTFNALGQLTNTKDASGSAEEVVTTYDYDSLGNLDTVVVDSVTVASMVFDEASNRTSITDSDSGTTTFDFDALGQVITQTDALSQVTKFTFDKLGRLEERVDRHGAGNAVTNTWNWDATNATGQLASRTNGQFTQTYTYRAADARLTSMATTVNVSGVLNQTFTQGFVYNSAGQLITLEQPNRDISFTYNTRGFRTTANDGSYVMHEWLDTDAYGNSTSEETADGTLTTTRTFDPASGRLTAIQTGPVGTPKSIQDLEYKWRTNSALYQRVDLRNTVSTADDLTDTFTYDDMERLKQQNTTVGASRQLNFTYDDTGNLTAKTSNVSGDLDVTPYNYATSGKPHRLTSATIGGIANTFSYDSNGNITRYDAASGDDKFLDYDGQNNVTRITVGTSSTTTTPTARDEFWYAPDGQRFLSRESWDASGTQRQVLTVYLDGYEEVTPHTASGYSKVQKYYASERTSLFRRTATGGAIDYKYITYQTDHLGSVDSVYVSGIGLDEKTSHDPFGARRQADWSADISSTALTALETIDDRYSPGFTFHEQRLHTGFVHMNGRVYDPEIGRFVSPDPFVSDPDFSQAYNRYSYVYNSPMSFADPSGFTPLCFGVPGFDTGSQVCISLPVFHDLPAGTIEDGTGFEVDYVPPAGPSYSPGDIPTLEPCLDCRGLDRDAGDKIADFLEEALRRSEGYPPVKSVKVGVVLVGSIGKEILPILRRLIGPIMKRVSRAGPKSGSSGGPGTGKDFRESTKDTARGESGNKCVFCKVDTIRSKTPHPRRSNIDHAVPKARKGNNTLENAQNTCQKCNLDKGTRTTEEYLEVLKTRSDG